MTLKQQVTSLELSKQLKDLGVKQESLFWWVRNYPNTLPKWILGTEKELSDIGTQNQEYSAFTTSELGERLPEWVYSKKWLDGYGCFVDGEPDNLPQPKAIMYDKTEVNVRAMMLIHLKENGLLEVEK